MDKQTRKHFIAFLKKNDALIPFLCNLASGINSFTSKPQSLSLTKHFKQSIKRRDSERHLILTAFLWRDTIEGDLYWRRMSRNWQNYINRGYQTLAEEHAVEHDELIAENA